MRTDQHADNFFDYVKQQAALHPTIEEPQLGRKRKNPTISRMELLDGYESSNEMFCHDNPSGHYRQLYFEIINIFVRSLKERFEQESFEHYAKMENVLLAAINGEELFEEGIALLRNEYNDDLDIDTLVAELPVLKTFFKDIEVVCFDDIIKHFRRFSNRN